MKATRYFEEQVLRKRPYIQLACDRGDPCHANSSYRTPDRRIRIWGAVADPRDGQTRYLRIVILEDGETVHNAFFDRDFEDKNR